MSTPEQKFTARLRTTAVQNVVGTRIYADIMPQPPSTSPSVVYQVIDARATKSTEGFSNHWTMLIQVSVYAQTSALARELSRLVIAALGAANDATFQCSVTARRDNPEPDVNLISIQMDFTVLATEDTTSP